MGRRKTYDRDEVTERAMYLFWERGYHATSTRDLTEAMGVNPYSLYSEFGSKEELYDNAMEHYHRSVVTKHFGRLETNDATLEHVEAVVRYFGGGAEVRASTLGCLACNAAIELGPTSQTTRESTERYMERLSAAFHNAMRNAQANGRMTEDAPIAELAEFFTITVTGMLVLIRSGSKPEYLTAAATQALARLDEFVRPVAPSPE